MKKQSNAIKVIFFALVLLMSFTMSKAQKQATVTPVNDFSSETHLLIETETWECREGGTQAIVYHQIDGDVLDSRRYNISWYDFSGKMVGNSSRTPGCLCGAALFVVVYDRVTNETATATAAITRCKPVSNADSFGFTSDPENN